MRGFGIASIAAAALSTALFATSVTADLPSIVIKVRIPPFVAFQYRMLTIHRDLISSTRMVPSSSFVVSHINKMLTRMAQPPAHLHLQTPSPIQLGASRSSASFREPSLSLPRAVSLAASSDVNAFWAAAPDRRQSPTSDKCMRKHN